MIAGLIVCRTRVAISLLDWLRRRSEGRITGFPEDTEDKLRMPGYELSGWKETIFRGNETLFFIKWHDAFFQIWYV